MNDLLNLAQRLEEACDMTGSLNGRHVVKWIRARASQDATGTISYYADCIENEARLFDDLAAVAKEAVAALRSLGIPRDISTAPPGDGWILAYDPSITGRSPWLPATRCDGGWIDNRVDMVDPTMWVPLPDPQPEPSGWRPAEGHVEIASGLLCGKPVFIATVIKPDGTQDIPRDADIADTAEAIRHRAAIWAEQLGLPVVDTIDANVLPFRPGGSQP